MTAMLAHDTLELLNGPEDGSEFAITESSVDIGAGPGCAVRIRFDEQIRPSHARLSAVAEGYRVRALEGGRVLVNGKKAGRLRSRHFRNGDVLRVGNSEFFLHCVEDGVAARSHGTALDSDFAWIMRTAGRRGWLLVRVLWRGLRRLLGPLFWPVAGLLAVFFLIRWFLPGLTAWLWYHLSYWMGYLKFRIWDWLT